MGALVATSLVGCVSEEEDIIDEGEVAQEVLGPPMNVTVTPTKTDRATVAWDAVAGATKYYVYWSTSTSGPFTFLDSSRTTSLPVAHLTANTNYCFQVSTEDGTGAGNPSPIVCAMQPNLPSPPGLVVPTKISETSQEVSWNPVAGATKYYVYQSTASSGPFTLIGTPSGTTRFYNARNLTPNTKYCFRVAVETSVGKSGQSPSSCTGTVAPPTGVTATKTAATRARVDFTQVASGVTKYYIYEMKDGGARRQRATVLQSAAPTYNAASLTPGSLYCYEIRSQGSAGTNISGYSRPAACVQM